MRQTFWRAAERKPFCFPHPHSLDEDDDDDLEEEHVTKVRCGGAYNVSPLQYM